MTQTPDDDAWLERIRCPRYFDFEAALTVPCPNSGDTNPPLRDSVYESDDETRTFFRALETDYSLHNTPHPQENSPPRADLRNLRPVHRHRPSTSFEQYLQKFKDPQDANPARDSGSPIHDITQSAQHTPTGPQQKVSVTPKRNPGGKPSRTPTKTTTALNADLKTATLESTPPRKSLKQNPSTPSRPPIHTSTEPTRKSAPNEPIRPRRRRPPERVSPPLNSVSSKSTSGGFGRAKSRKAIARSDNTEGHQGHLSRVGQSAVTFENASFSKKDSEKPTSKEKENVYTEGIETNLLDVDSDTLRMMEEHNRRIQRRQAQAGGKVGKENSDSGNTDGMNNGVPDQKVKGHGFGITLRNRNAELDPALQLDENFGKRGIHAQEQVSSVKGKLTGEAEEQRSVEQQGNESESRVEANQQVRLTRIRQRTANSLLQNDNLGSHIPNDDDKWEETSLDQLLKSENERVLEERKKRLPERRKALQVDKNVALKTLEGQRAEQDSQRIIAKVEFTSANGNSRAGTSALLNTNQGTESGNRDRGRENNTRRRPLAIQSRKRGFKAFRERSRMGPSSSATTGLSSVPSQTQKTRNVTSTRRRQPYTDKVKASERQKRLEKRLEEDLQSLLSQHNNRVKGNRRAYSTDEQ